MIGQQWIVVIEDAADENDPVFFGPIRDEGLAAAYASEFNDSHPQSTDTASVWPLRDPHELMISIARGTEIHREAP